MVARIYDISQTLRPSLPVWPGDTVFQAEPVWSHGDGSPVAVARLILSPHSGAHADAPLHYDPDGASMADVDLQPYLGVARVIDVRGCEGQIRPEHFAGVMDPSVRRVLFRTFDRFPHDDWAHDFAVPSVDAIEFLNEQGVILIGVDAPSLDVETSKTMDAHRAVRAAGMRILEGLVLDDVAAGDYELIALPLKLQGVDASPVRAILRVLAV